MFLLSKILEIIVSAREIRKASKVNLLERKIKQPNENELPI